MGQSLTARWRIGALAAEQIEGVEASVLWYTEGKGGEDLHVHAFRRWSDADLRQFDITQPRRLRCDLPLSPLSYEGTLLRIRWCVRLRLFRSCGRDTVVQAPFQLVHQLGHIGDSGSRSVITHLPQRDSLRDDLTVLTGRLS